ncbi:Uma2 family endonuclease [Calothrix sp. CCY 0018]|uniref:Uma2 family endonuclease n=1 Tax=Calothrix sp. CCY 0018 TaxID=3103864 RepID=UPI0039C75222
MNTSLLTSESTLQLTIDLTDEQFWQLCQKNQEWKFERTASGELLIMSPTGGETGNRNIEIAYQLQGWSRKNNLGKAFDSSTGFKLPNGADRSPDASWITIEKWESLTKEQRRKFLPLCPDFVLELRSPTDSLKKIREKMQEYMENGARLGWLINVEARQVEIYRQGKDVEILEAPITLSGEDVLPGFVFDLTTIM